MIKYKIKSARVEEDTVYTTVRYAFNNPDLPTITVEVAHFRPENFAAITTNLDNRGVTEQAKAQAIAAGAALMAEISSHIDEEVVI